MIRVLIVDDQALMRAGFRMILEAQEDIEVVGEAGDGEAAIATAATSAPDVVLMDIRMPRLDGVEATRLLPDHRVIILTTFDHDEYVVEALRAGASGFLLKDSPPEDLVRAVRVVAAGDALLAPTVTRRLLDRVAPTLRNSGSGMAHFDQLTARERDVLQMVARGRSNSEIAARLHIGETTVKTHVSHLLEKLDLRDRVQAVVLAYEAGLVAPGEAGESSG
ncbi:MAG: response regulator [Candidatus Dormibacteria bacterium]